MRPAGRQRVTLLRWVLNVAQKWLMLILMHHFKVMELDLKLDLKLLYPWDCEIAIPRIREMRGKQFQWSSVILNRCCQGKRGILCVWVSLFLSSFLVVRVVWWRSSEWFIHAPTESERERERERKRERKNERRRWYERGRHWRHPIRRSLRSINLLLAALARRVERRSEGGKKNDRPSYCSRSL